MARTGIATAEEVTVTVIAVGGQDLSIGRGDASHDDPYNLQGLAFIPSIGV